MQTPAFDLRHRNHNRRKRQLDLSADQGQYGGRRTLEGHMQQVHAGALLEILQVCAKREVNLTFIQSRPTGRELGHYHFIIDVEGHIKDPAVGGSIAELKEICDDIRFLGSYPREAQ